jgi:hypothetical protein
MSRDYADLLSYLRVAVDKQVPSVVVAGVGAGGGPAQVITGLAAAARAGGLRLATAEIAGGPGRPVLRQRRLGEIEAAGSQRPEAAPALLEAEGATARRATSGGTSQDAAARGLQAVPPAGPSPIAVERWGEAVGADIVLIEAPPLAASADAALLARVCDGLVLVVEAAVTSRAELRRAVRLAETSGCRVIGLVMRGKYRALPSWLRRLLHGSARGT